MSLQAGKIAEELRQLAAALTNDQSQVSMGDIDLITLAADQLELTAVVANALATYDIRRATRDAMNESPGKIPYFPIELRQALLQLDRKGEIR